MKKSEDTVNAIIGLVIIILGIVGLFFLARTFLSSEEPEETVETQKQTATTQTTSDNLNALITQSSNETFDVRKVRWGMSRPEVEKSESWELFQSTSSGPVYKGKILGYECHLHYNLYKNKLTEVRYLFLDSTRERFNTIKILLEKKYGSPNISESNQIGWLVKQRTYIVLGFSATGNAVLLQFVDKNHKDLQLNQIKSQAMEEF